MIEENRKYQYKKPSGSKEHLEAIYEELSQTSGSANGHYHASDTLKANVAQLLHCVKQAEYRRESEKMGKKYAVDLALGGLAFLAYVFLVKGRSGPSDWAWLNEHRYAIWLWGVAFATVFVGVSIERTSFFKHLWAFGFTKVAASVAVSALFVFCTGKASSLINAVFSVDASALPYTRAIVTGLLAFKYSQPLLFVVAAAAAIHALVAVSWVRAKFGGNASYELPPFMSIVFVVLAGYVLFISNRTVNQDFSDELWPAKVYMLAHVLDFNSNHSCVNLKPELSVIFLGPDQGRVLVDPHSAQTNDLESLVEAVKSAEVEVPKQFYRLPCNLVQISSSPEQGDEPNDR